MTYASELDDYRQEVRKGYAANKLRFWPKVRGTGNVKVDASPAPTAQIFDQRNKPLGAATVAPTDVGSPAVTRLDITIDATALPLEEGYRVDLLYTVSGEELAESLYFDCARHPFLPDVSLNDLEEEVADIATILDRQAKAIDPNRTAEQHASTIGVKAWNDIRIKLRTSIQAQRRIFPRLILDKESIRRVVVAQTMARVYRGEGGKAESAPAYQHEQWAGEAERRFTSLGELPYDELDDGTATAKLQSPSVVFQRRAWPG